MSICHSGRILDVTYPVARMRSMIPRILRRLALWMGSDRPIPWCTGGVFGGVESPIDDASGVVAKESMDETEGVLLRELWDIEPVRFRLRSFYRYTVGKEVWRYRRCGTICSSPRVAPSSSNFSVLYSAEQIRGPNRSLRNGRSLDMM